MKFVSTLILFAAICRARSNPASLSGVVTLGNERPGIPRAHGLVNFDFSLSREFRVAARSRIELRSGFFAAAACGVVSSSGSARQIELGGPVVF